MNLETVSENVRAMGESVKSAAIPGKYTEVYVEEGTS